MSRSAVTLLASTAFVASACGGGSEGTPPAEPSLPRALAETLATKSEAVAERLDAGDSCGAAEEATSLKEAALTAIEDGEIPPAFQAELEASVTELAGQILCEEEEDNSGKGKGQGKGKNGNGGNGNGGNG